MPEIEDSESMALEVLAEVRDAQETLAENHVEAIEKELSEIYCGEANCPICKSVDIRAYTGIDSVELGYAQQHCECESCGVIWREEWKMTAIYDIKQGGRS